MTIHCHFVYSKFRCLKACSFVSFIHTSLLGFGWKRVAINSGPKNPKDMLKKRHVSPSHFQYRIHWQYPQESFQHRHSIPGQLSSYLRMCSAADLPKVYGSTNSLFSTAVISGSSSAPELKNAVPPSSAGG
ncbi:inositol hexakisphosphate and diphosphoinositol-pentakisphosphate kinase [Trichonephila clavipes]|nr:inositol hexakisphosphate and diphosphoinositol-pentakisphosphate kinase [Trichonephila clavipes]